MNPAREALNEAVEKFESDRDARIDALEARRDLRKAIVAANFQGVSDQQLANAFQRADKQRALSRARIQQIRTKDRL